MGNLEQFTESVIGRVIGEKYPHIGLPSIVYATVTGAKELDDTYVVTGLEITDEDNERTFKAQIKAHWYEYSLKVIDRLGNADSTFPELPGVRSKLSLEQGAIVAVGLAFGDITLTIIGEVTL